MKKEGKQGKSRDLRFERVEREAWEERFECAELMFEYQERLLLQLVSGCCTRNSWNEEIVSKCESKLHESE